MSVDGYRVDTNARTVGGLHGPQFALDQLEYAGSTLFYARSIPDDRFITYQKTWLIADQNWAVTRFTFHEHLRARAIDWKIEPDPISIDGAVWHVTDGFIDLDVYEGTHYELEDADELAEALLGGTIAIVDTARALHALDAVCKELHTSGYSVTELLRRFAPQLPRP